MRRQRVYVDTSVIGGCFDSGFREASIALLESALSGEIVLVLSDLLAFELQNAPQVVRDLYEALPNNLVELVVTGSEEDGLHAAYLSAGVVGAANEGDAMHVAAATVANCDIIVSWNFKHIVHYDKIRGYNAVNLREGYRTLAIHSPKEVV